MNLNQAIEILQEPVHKTMQPQSLGYSNLGKYGMIALEYLKNKKPGLYTLLKTQGRLMEEMLNLEQQANELQDKLTAQMKAKHPLPETESFILLTQYETGILLQAEEIVLNEIIYSKFS